jgi:tetratricopeptide (TPR) repeat protein
MPLHVFVAMPFGVKEGVDFDAVYRDYIAPSVRAANCEILRADDALLAGDIHTDMFQELLLADLVVVDLSIDNPNVWYELGVRHALRSRGIIHIRGQRDRLPFDVQGERTLRYRIRDGKPDPDYLESDKDLLVQFIRGTIDSWRGHKHSPVYHLLPNLREPDWRSLKVGTINEFWDAFKRWERRVEVARRHDRAGDILVLADEAPSWVLQLESRRVAAQALSDLGQHSLALEQVELSLALDPNDLHSRHMKALQLGRLKRYEEATIWIEEHLEEQPNDAEAWAILGRIRKETWLHAWHDSDKTYQEQRKAVVNEDESLRAAYGAYLQGFLHNPGSHYAGINAATLARVLRHVTGEPDHDETSTALEGGVRWAAESALAQDSRDYWAKATIAELRVLSGTPEQVSKAYKAAVVVSERNWFRLNSSWQQLDILRALGLNPDSVDAGIEELDRELTRLAASRNHSGPHRVFLFSGHMIDAPDRNVPRFPPEKIDLAAAAIDERLDTLGAGSDDFGLCGGACGGDLLFAESCQRRGMKVEVRLPGDIPSFVRNSVAYAGESWTNRFYSVVEHPGTHVLIMPDDLGPTPPGVNAYTRNNLWQLYSALVHGPENIRFVCLWDGQSGDGPGGTGHMLQAVQLRAGRVSIIDTKALFFGGAQP